MYPLPILRINNLLLLTWLYFKFTPCHFLDKNFYSVKTEKSFKEFLYIQYKFLSSQTQFLNTTINPGNVFNSKLVSYLNANAM